MARGNNEPAHSGAGSGQPDVSVHRRRLLLVEPNRPTRLLYARELGKLWEVSAAAGVQEARELLAGEPPAAIVLEPYDAGAGFSVETDLADTWAFVKECAAHGESPVVICSVVDERRTAYALGAALCLLKPVSPQQLVFALQGLAGAAATKEHTP